MLCPKCKNSELRLEIETGGGCQGGHGPEEYCYCELPYARLELRCSNNNRNKKHPYCDYHHIPREYADQDSIARLLSKLLERDEQLIQELVDMKGQ